jgi:hypothetical protein
LRRSLPHPRYNFFRHITSDLVSMISWIQNRNPRIELFLPGEKRAVAAEGASSLRNDSGKALRAATLWFELYLQTSIAKARTRGTLCPKTLLVLDASNETFVDRVTQDSHGSDIGPPRTWKLGRSTRLRTFPSQGCRWTPTSMSLHITMASRLLRPSTRRIHRYRTHSHRRRTLFFKPPVT